MAERIMGRTHFAGLFELVQVCGIHRRDVILTVTQKGRTGRILIWDGDLCDAGCGDLRGDDAIYEIFGWTESFFELAPLTGDIERTVTNSNTDIMMKVVGEVSKSERLRFGPADRIAGPLDIMSPTELLQLFEMNRHSALLKLRNSGDTGHVHLREGRAVHAELGDMEGDRAVLDLLTWLEGDFVAQSSDEYVPETVVDSISGLILEGSRRIDLLGHLAEEEQKTWGEVAAQTVKRLEEGTLPLSERIALAKSYHPPGASLSVADLVELVKHPNANVRRNALETVANLPQAVLRVLLDDKETPNAIRNRVSPDG